MLERKENKAENMENYFTPTEVSMLEIAKKKLSSAIDQRSVDPVSFDGDIAFLKKLKEVIQNWQEVLVPHDEEKEKAEKDAQNAYFIFFKNKARDRVLEKVLSLKNLKNIYLILYYLNPHLRKNLELKA